MLDARPRLAQLPLAEMDPLELLGQREVSSVLNSHQAASENATRSTVERGSSSWTVFDRPDWPDSNRWAIDEAAELAVPVLVLVSGGLPEGSRDRRRPGPRRGRHRHARPVRGVGRRPVVERTAADRLSGAR